MTKLRQEAVTEVASWGVSRPLMGCRVCVFSMRLAKAAYTARRYTITAIILAMIRDTWAQKDRFETHLQLSTAVFYIFMYTRAMCMQH